ncbi:CPBP family intramembrane metalloprotease [Enterococcus faecalis]|uniref:CPBP family intramembrane metalloprotease n=1 Tax=Enterococcus faecalis TaxID=1351 RepID=A0A974S6I3_ENTFL|nr:CPBP family intramembrane metalloprotease [Enterococcus faecalis]
MATTIGGPIMEEFVFRYAFIHLIQPFTNFWIAATVSSAIFFTRTCRWSLFLFISLWDFFLCSFVQANWKKIWTSIIAHCGMNTIVIIVQLLFCIMVQFNKKKGLRLND